MTKLLELSFLRFLFEYYSIHHSLYRIEVYRCIICSVNLNFFYALEIIWYRTVAILLSIIKDEVAITKAFNNCRVSSFVTPIP